MTRGQYQPARSTVDAFNFVVRLNVAQLRDHARDAPFLRAELRGFKRATAEQIATAETECSTGFRNARRSGANRRRYLGVLGGFAVLDLRSLALGSLTSTFNPESPMAFESLPWSLT
jgi:hypothetical protein